MPKPYKTHCKYGHDMTLPGARTAPTPGIPWGRCVECQRDYAPKWRRDNRDKMREHDRKWVKANLEKKREAARKRYAESPEKNYEKGRKWRTENPEKVRAQAARRRARKLSQLGAFPLPEPEFIALLWETDPNCYYCRAPLGALYHVEHKIPLSRPEMKPEHWEGLHDFRNLRLACPDCNGRKGNKTAQEFLCQNS